MSSQNGTAGPEIPGLTNVPPTVPEDDASGGAGLGDALEALVKMAGDKSPGATPAQLKAWADLLSSFLSSPAVTTWAQAWGAAKQAEAAAKVELAKQQGLNEDAAHKRQTEVATTFLKSLALMGVAGMAFLAALAWSQVLDKQAFGVLASTFFTALFGTGIYGTAMKNKS